MLVDFHRIFFPPLLLFFSLSLTLLLSILFNNAKALCAGVECVRRAKVHEFYFIEEREREKIFTEIAYKRCSLLK